MYYGRNLGWTCNQAQVLGSFEQVWIQAIGPGQLDPTTWPIRKYFFFRELQMYIWWILQINVCEINF